MRFCIVIPSEEFAASAGVRIRYDRLAQASRELGHDIELQPIANFQSRRHFQHDVYIFAKTYTANALVLALRMRQSGCRVGLDIFDDYFTQDSDVRLLRFRQWGAEMAEIADFFLCSTPRLALAIAPMLNGKPLGVIADPSEIVDPQFLDHVLRRKAMETASGEPLRIVWFGIGDNPYFPVGLRDLAAFGGMLEAFGGQPAASLRIVTNARALTPAGLAMLRRLPLPFTIAEWSPERERRELLQAHVCFLPVNSQPFSRVKSLNRAITALAAGCQALSAGFPLYQDLESFIYRSAEQLRGDLRTGATLLRAATINSFTSLMIEKANPYRGAAEIAALAGSVDIPPVQDGAAGENDIQENSAPQVPQFPPDIAVVHGPVPDGKLHKLVQRLDGFAVKGPACRENWNCQLRLDVAEGGRLRVFAADAIKPLLGAPYQALCEPHGKIKDLEFHEVRLEATDLFELTRGWALAGNPSAIKLHAAAPRLTRDVLTICETLFPSMRFVANDRLLAVPPRHRAGS